MTTIYWVVRNPAFRASARWNLALFFGWLGCLSGIVLAGVHG